MHFCCILLFCLLIFFDRRLVKYWKMRVCLRRRVTERLGLWHCALYIKPFRAIQLTCTCSGEFADLLGEDYLGLRDSGIASEFGLSALSIPRKLLKGKKGQNKPTAVKPTEPPPPYPPPPPFIPLTAGMVDDQIGLLKPYYQNRFTKLAALMQPPSSTAPSLPGPSLPGLPGPSLPPPPSAPVPAAVHPDLPLPDELPSLVQQKISPIGQVVKSGASSGASKKKAAVAKVVVDPPVGTPGMSPEVSGVTPGTSPKKKKSNTGVGSGNGRKKKPDGPGSTPTPGYGGPVTPTLPAVVFASA